MLLLANGVTGIRDAASYGVPFDTMLHWRREILAGTRVGPPRQILSVAWVSEGKGCTRERREQWALGICVLPGDSADARRLVEELKAAGIDMLKMYTLSPATYFYLAAAARRVGLPFGGHIDTPDARRVPATLSAIEASDSGARIIDHPIWGLEFCWTGRRKAPWGDERPWAPVSVEECQRTAEHFQRNGTWLVPTLTKGRWGVYAASVENSFSRRLDKFWDGALFHGNWLRDLPHAKPPADSLALRLVQRVGMPILAGTDASADASGMFHRPPGFLLHLELAAMVAEGLPPVEALRAATLNPAKMLRGTDSLGTVAAGKLADLVLLDADPMADITNTTTIRAVVANGRYFDRAALDSVLVAVQAEARQGVAYWPFVDKPPSKMTIERFRETRRSWPGWAGP